MALLDIFRIYDRHVVDFVRHTVNPIITQLDVDVSDDVSFASPERPYAARGNNPQSREQAERTKHVSGLIGNFQYDDLVGQTETTIDEQRGVQTFATPRVSVTRLTWQFSSARNNTVPVRRLRVWDADGKQNFYLQTAKGIRPWDLHYQLDFQTRFREDMNQLLRWYLYHPDQTYSIQVDFKYPWGFKSIPLQFDQIVDNSDIETGEKERAIRYTIPMTVEGWMLEAYDGERDIPFDSVAPNFWLTQKTRIAKTVCIQHALASFDAAGNVRQSTIIELPETCFSGSTIALQGSGSTTI